MQYFYMLLRQKLLNSIMTKNKLCNRINIYYNDMHYITTIHIVVFIMLVRNIAFYLFPGWKEPNTDDQRVVETGKWNETFSSFLYWGVRKDEL